MPKTVLVFDLGATIARALLCRCDDGAIAEIIKNIEK